MKDLILGNLIRQARGLELLESLQLEELELLVSGKVREIGGLEFSIHELMRQLAAEREELRRRLGGARLREYAAPLPEEEAGRLMELFREIDAAEQRCARQAERNSSLSLALLDQSHELMNFFYESIVPREEPAYGAGGARVRRRPAASLLNGRL
ncbi:MAG: flagellar protein FlgN [Deltaproteobacteria bacterium]|jgi:hypothetical protein|nr:flagellar protein FlgN [Deltaproteobacteria bacterium]